MKTYTLAFLESEKSKFHFIVDDDFKPIQLYRIFLRFKDDYNCYHEDGFSLNEESLDELVILLNPLSFAYDRILIRTCLAAILYGYKSLESLLEKKDIPYFIYEENILDKLEIGIAIKVESIASLIEKYYGNDPNYVYQSLDIDRQRGLFCDYIQKISLNNSVAIIAFDKILLDYFFQKKLDIYNFRVKNDAMMYQISEMKSFLEIIQNAIRIHDNAEAFQKDINVSIRNGKKNPSIKVSKTITSLIMNEITNKSTEILNRYLFVFKLHSNDFLHVRDSEKNNKRFENIKANSSDYRKSLKKLNDYFIDQLTNHSKEVNVNTAKTLSIRVDSYLSDHIPSLSKLQVDFIIMEILQFAKFDIQNKSDPVCFLPIKNKTASEFASKRQDELDRIRWSWLN